eukprot:CAMPEP_0178901012 /NCGR_PEP_ID=MMETSP0786-20121207/3781_1 /TAXON_ID=186022 /ORGANISM="Thalassionema frauenfeldii, Strain CCMP 1798" /LENGTH=294 /DNA_ID=CAMNT_0020572057 /DNA_START=178 /DNA_END=1062 /DNA_ORIENTATION=+
MSSEEKDEAQDSIVPPPNSIVPLELSEDEQKDLSSADESAVDTTGGKKTFRMVYTCNRCGTRNMLEIKRKTWEEGVVISTCQGCNVKHLLADNKGLMNIGKNYNVVDDKKDAVTSVNLDSSMDDATKDNLLNDFDLTRDEKGNIQLVPREGDSNIVKKDRVSATGPEVDPSLIEPDVQRPQTVPLGKEEDAPSARMDSYGEAAAFDIDIPDGIEAGDLLQLAVNNQPMMLLVPEGAKTSVKVLGAIEFAVPKDNVPGDIVTLEVPNDEPLVIQIPDGVYGGSFLKVAYPVVPNP